MSEISRNRHATGWTGEDRHHTGQPGRTVSLASGVIGCGRGVDNIPLERGAGTVSGVAFQFCRVFRSVRSQVSSPELLWRHMPGCERSKKVSGLLFSGILRPKLFFISDMVTKPREMATRLEVGTGALCH